VVRENSGTEEEQEQFLALTEDALYGYESESIEVLPADSILTRINLDLVASLSSKGTEFSLKLKNGNEYLFVGPDADIWCKLIKQLLSDQ